MTTTPDGTGPLEKGGKMRLLHARLRELKIQLSGLPPQVAAYLLDVVETEVSTVQDELAIEVQRLQKKADERTRRNVAKLINLKSVGKAFGHAIGSTTPPQPSPDASSEAGGEL